MMGKPVVEGTRITVEHILEELGAGQTIEQLPEAQAIHDHAARMTGSFIVISPGLVRIRPPL